MIKITLQQIIESAPAFRKISNKEISARTAFKIARIIKSLENEYQNFNTAREQIIKKYCEIDLNGKPIISDDKAKIKEENLTIFNKEISDLLTTEIELVLDKLSLDELEEIEITPSSALIIMPFIKE